MSEDRRCSNCGQSVEDEPYELWLFSSCRACAMDAMPQRWGIGGTARKWAYRPNWHLTRHPDRPKQIRERHKARGET